MFNQNCIEDDANTGHARKGGEIPIVAGVITARARCFTRHGICILKKEYLVKSNITSGVCVGYNLGSLFPVQLDFLLLLIRAIEI